MNVIPALFLARKVQPLLIHMRGAGRLNQHQSNKHIYYFFVFIYFLSLSLVSFFSFFVVLQDWRAAIHEALGRSGRPRAAHSRLFTLTGSLPGERGFGSQKRPPDCLAYRASGGPPSARAAAHRARRRGYTVTCSCANTLFGDSAGTKL